MIKEHFNHKDIGDVDAMKGPLESIPCHMCGMEEPDHVMTLMTMHGTFEWMGDNAQSRY